MCVTFVRLKLHFSYEYVYAWLLQLRCYEEENTVHSCDVDW